MTQRIKQARGDTRLSGFVFSLLTGAAWACSLALVARVWVGVFAWGPLGKFDIRGMLALFAAIALGCAVVGGVAAWWTWKRDFWRLSPSLIALGLASAIGVGVGAVLFLMVFERAAQGSST